MQYPYVEEIATQNIIMLDVTATLKDAIDIITEKGVRNIVVVDTDVDLYAYIGIDEIVHFSAEEVALDTPLSSLGLHPLILIPKKYDVFDASTLFLHEVSLLGVSNDDGTLFGVLSHFDILSVGAKMSEHIMESPIEVLVFNTNIIRTAPDTILESSLPQLGNPQMDCLIVEENNKPIGIITKRDITRFLAQEQNLKHAVKTFMNAPLVTFPNNISIREALATVQEYGYKRILVTNDDGSLVGVITEQALINLIYNRIAQKSAIGIDRFNTILEQKLKEQSQEHNLFKERYELAMTATNDGIWDWDLEKQTLFLSPSWKRMLGFEDEEIQNSYESWDALLHPDDATHAKTQALKLVNNELKDFSIEFRLRCKDESYKWILSRAKIVERFENGLPKRILGTHVDISEKKNAELSLHKSEERFRDFTLCTTDWVWEIDSQGRYTYVSEGIIQLLGYLPQEVIGKTPFDLMPEEEAKRLTDIFEEIITQKASFKNLENINLHKNGKQVIVETSGIAIFDDENNFIGYRGTDRDITQRKENELTLRQQDFQISLAQKSANLAVFIDYLGQKEDYWADNMYDIFELDRSTTPSQEAICGLIHPEDKERVTNHISNAILKKQAVTDEFRVITPKGSLKYIRTTLNYFTNEKHDYAAGILADVTNEVQQQKEYELLFESAQIGLMYITGDRVLIKANPRLAEMFGYDSPEEMVGLGMRSFHLNEDNFISFGEKNFYSLTNGKKRNIEYPLKRKDGSTIWVTLSGKALDDTIPADLSKGVLWSLQDMTKRKELEEKNNKQKVELETIFHTSKDGIALLDLESNFIRVNDAYRKFTGYSEAELLQKSCIGMTVPEDLEATKIAFQKCMKSGFVENHEKSCVVKDGKRITINMSLALMPGSKHILITTKNMTEEVHLREELISAKEKAEMISQFKSEFLANMSHEIRTPMNAILGFVEQLKKHEVDPLRLQQFKLINNSGNTLLHIINDILDFSKIESGKMEVESIPYNIHEVLYETSSVFTEVISNKAQEFEIKIDANIPNCILGDQVRIKQVIFNLLSNAIKFTPDNGCIKLEASYMPKTKEIYIAVCDTGIGIPENKLQKIFEAFNQQDTTTTRKYGGTGLGLTISTSLLNMMGTKLQVNSKVREGSCFYFNLPTHQCSEQISIHKDDLQTSLKTQLKGHVLVVEDNKTNQMLLCMILDDLGISYDVANDGIEGFNAYTQKNYALVLMDENMPNMNGIEATNQIRLFEHEEHKAATPVVAVTANALAEDKERFLDAGMDDYVSKPYSEEDIRRVLIKYLQ